MMRSEDGRIMISSANFTWLCARSREMVLGGKAGGISEREWSEQATATWFDRVQTQSSIRYISELIIDSDDFY